MLSDMVGGINPITTCYLNRFLSESKAVSHRDRNVVYSFQMISHYKSLDNREQHYKVLS